MLSLILGVIILAWLLYQRLVKKVEVPEAPLGLPAGSIRAFTAILIVSFPFTYLWPLSGDIPGTIASAIFVVVAFYFKRRLTTRTTEEIVEEVKNPAPADAPAVREKQWHPLYIPKYSVRIVLITLVVSFALVNYLTVNVALAETNTSVDLVLVVAFFVLGTIAGSISNKRVEKDLRDKILTSDRPAEELVTEIEARKGELQTNFQRFFAVLTFFTTITALLLYVIPGGETIVIPLGDTFSYAVRDLLLLMINVYYGWRN